MEYADVELYIKWSASSRFDKPRVLRIPLDITVSELLQALDDVYGLGGESCGLFMSAENPEQLLQSSSKTKLSKLSIRTGTRLYCTRQA